VEAAASSSFAPSALARETALKELGAEPGESDEAFARRAFAAALSVERALRFGATCQEARARLHQELRLESSAGAENGKRMVAKLAKSERKNLKNQKSALKKVLKAAANAEKSAEKSGGKGKSGQ
jgi:nucleotidyltransferase/DNA polymerase involved in DNA repair